MLTTAKVDLDSLSDRDLLREVRARGYAWAPLSREVRCTACGIITREWDADWLHVGGHDTPVLHLRCTDLTRCIARQQRTP